VSAALEEAERGADTALEGPAPALRSAITDLGHGRESAPRSVRLGRATARALGLPESEVGLVSFAASAPGAGIAEAGERPAPETAAAGETDARAAAGPEGDAVRLSRVETMSAVREILLSRHEWWDGSGYPRGLEGAEIPIGGRILAVVDAFERMTTTGKGRRAALSREESIGELKQLAGARFDPEVVDAFEGAAVELERTRSEDSADSWEHASATQGGE